MSAYTAEITAYVATNFPNPDHDAAYRSALVTFLDGSITTLVIPADPFNQRTEAIRNLLILSIYLNDPYLLQILVACEYSLNLAITANDLIPSGVKYFKTNISQSGTSAPTNVIVKDDIGIVSTAFVSTGLFNLVFPANSFPDATKVIFSFCNPIVTGSNNVLITVLNSTTIRIETRVCTANLIFGTISAAVANSILSSSDLIIEVQP